MNGRNLIALVDTHTHAHTHTHTHTHTSGFTQTRLLAASILFLTLFVYGSKAFPFRHLRNNVLILVVGCLQGAAAIFLAIASDNALNNVALIAVMCIVILSLAISAVGYNIYLYKTGEHDEGRFGDYGAANDGTNTTKSASDGKSTVSTPKETPPLVDAGDVDPGVVDAGDVELVVVDRGNDDVAAGDIASVATSGDTIGVEGGSGAAGGSSAGNSPDANDSASNGSADGAAV